MNAFITGSRVYGSPRPNSDIDLVLRIDYHTSQLLQSLSDTPQKDKHGNIIVRFGRLNLLLCESDEEFATWLVGTKKMELEKNSKKTPISRDAARDQFDLLRAMIGIDDTHGSGDETTKDDKAILPMYEGK